MLRDRRASRVTPAFRVTLGLLAPQVQVRLVQTVQTETPAFKVFRESMALRVTSDSRAVRVFRVSPATLAPQVATVPMVLPALPVQMVAGSRTPVPFTMHLAGSLRWVTLLLR